MGRHKRHRGGQPGNQNARKHGLYSPYVNSAELKQLNKAVNKGMDKQLAVIQIKIQSALVDKPADKRLYRQASDLLTNWFRSNYPCDETDVKELRSLTRNSLKTIRLQLAETIKAISREKKKNLTGPIKLNDKKPAKNDGTVQSQNFRHPKRIASQS